MRIAILVEGATEKAFKGVLHEFLKKKVPRNMPKLNFIVFNGRIPTGEKLKRTVEYLLQEGNQAVIALTDVYTGNNEFKSAQDAKEKMIGWVPNISDFYPHVALHDFEAWLFPFWSDIQQLAGSDKKSPNNNPEQINHGKPPAHVLNEIFRLGDKKKCYSKVRDSVRILRNKDLTVAAQACPELKAFLNTILILCRVPQSELL
ncbi:MAG: DUF4276 family protein [Ferrovum sp.]|nr:DUF4276 family protein [Ferrovum sp.]